MARRRTARGGEGEPIELAIQGVHRTPGEGEYEPVALATNRGEIALRYYGVPDAHAGAIFVGGVGGGWDTPGRGRLYTELCGDLVGEGVSALRVRYRHPTVLEEAALDVLAALHFLETEGVAAAAVTGHSFGGAVVAQAAAHAGIVRVAVLLSTQAYGVQAIAEAPPGCATLVVHGTADEVLPPYCSQYAYELAHEPKRIRLYDGTHHGLDENADEIRQEVREWILARLSAPQAGSPG